MDFEAMATEIGLEVDEFMELVELFMEVSLADYNHLRSALESGDIQQVARRAHTICGASGNLGFVEIHQLARQIELSAMKGEATDQLSGEVDALQPFFDKIARALSSSA